MSGVEKRFVNKWGRPCFWLLAFIHTVLLAWSAYRHSPTQDEIAHLPAGLIVWKYNDFSVYRVNPPLVRACAAVPLLFLKHKEDWSWYQPNANFRNEWNLGRSFVIANGPDSYWLFTLARWCCLPFSLLGMWVCFRWASEMTSPVGGLVAATLWGFSPNVLGHGALITPDIAATSMGVLAAWRFCRWMNRSTVRNAMIAGGALGIALLTKTYWITLLGLWPGLVVLRWFCMGPEREVLRDLRHLALMLLIGLYLLNLGYRFNGTGRPLKEYGFCSQTLSGEKLVPGENLPGNRFSNLWLGWLPVPFPQDYVTGIDLQKVDFETGKWSYFWGEVKESGGWGHYYFVGLFLKVPLGTWALTLIALLEIFRNPSSRTAARQLLTLAVPVITIFVMASLQTHMNRHVRYVFPVLPLLCLVSAFAVTLRLRMVVVFVLCTVVSSVAAYPHSLSYFNWSIGGPNHGHHYLIDSNLDWGQDMLFLREWLEDHPQARPAWVGWHGFVPLESLGIAAQPILPRDSPAGWYFVSRHQRQHPNGRLRRFDQLQPVGQIGFTFDIYHLEKDPD